MAVKHNGNTLTLGGHEAFSKNNHEGYDFKIKFLAPSKVWYVDHYILNGCWAEDKNYTMDASQVTCKKCLKNWKSAEHFNEALDDGEYQIISITSGSGKVIWSA